MTDVRCQDVRYQYVRSQCVRRQCEVRGTKYEVRGARYEVRDTNCGELDPSPRWMPRLLRCCPRRGSGRRGRERGRDRHWMSLPARARSRSTCRCCRSCGCRCCRSRSRGRLRRAGLSAGLPALRRRGRLARGGRRSPRFCRIDGRPGTGTRIQAKLVSPPRSEKPSPRRAGTASVRNIANAK